MRPDRQQQLRLTTILVVAASTAVCGFAGSPKAVADGRPSAAVTLKLTLPMDHISVGHGPLVFVTLKNNGTESVAFPEVGQVHVEREVTGAPATLSRRRGAIGPAVERGDSFTTRLDLAKVYDLSRPGRYTVYVEAGSAGARVRSNTAAFEVQAPGR